MDNLKLTNTIWEVNLCSAVISNIHRILDQWTKRCAKSFWCMLGCAIPNLHCFHSVVCLFVADISFNGTASQPHHWYPSMLQVDPSGGLRFLCYHLRLPDRSNTNPPGAQNRSELPNIPGQNQQVLSPSKIILMRRDVGHFREVAMIKWRHDAWMVDEIETCSCNQKLPFQVPPSHNLRSLSALACIFGGSCSLCVLLYWDWWTWIKDHHDGSTPTVTAVGFPDFFLSASHNISSRMWVLMPKRSAYNSPTQQKWTCRPCI